MASLSSCPACNTTLTLFTPREISRHINACLDAQPKEPQSHHSLPRCPVCQRNLSALTPAARAEHENRCVDNLNPRPKKNPSLKQTKLVPARSTSPPKRSTEDNRVRRFLELLGLERYAQRFADEEVDFPALRLLEHKDFAQLRIPDAARRRIADALTAVPILAQLGGAQLNEPTVDPALVPTQRFGTSRLAPQMQRNKLMVQLDDSDGEYAPTPIVQNSPNHARLATEKTCQEHDIDEQKENGTGEDTFRAIEDKSRGASDEESNDFEEIEPVVRTGHVARVSESSCVSSFASNLEDVSELLRSTSQITIELKLQEWRRRQIQREKIRHSRELERIETEYRRLIKNEKIHEDPQESDTGGSSEVLKNPTGHNCDTIDLTQDISGEEDNPETHVANVSSAKMFEKSIVISSNESALNASSTPQRDSQQAQRRGDSCPKLSQKEPDLDTHNTARSIARPDSPTSETRTPDQTKGQTSEEEVINLISAEKKQGSGRPVNVTLPRSGNNIAPLFAPTPNRDEVNGAPKNTSDSDEDFMDLLGVGKENSRSFSQPSHPPEEALKRSSTEYDSSTTEEEAPTQSRLKKRAKKGKRVKATSQDIAQLIRTDKALYEDILMMDSVPFDRIMGQLRRGKKHVTKKALYDFLQNEGIMFKGDSVEPGSQQELYMLLLNSDKCTD